MSRLEVLVATMNQSNFDLYSKMNIHTDAVFANQSNRHSYEHKTIDGNNVQMITTPFKGVGRNRNLALLYASADFFLFADDDMTYVDNYEDGIINAFNELPSADVIVFSYIDVKNKTEMTTIQNKRKRLSIFNCFKYGTFSIAIKKSSIEKANICFSHLFGGGAVFGSGEDSLFLKKCLNFRLKIFSHQFIIGYRNDDKSTWFTGYNDKFFLDKGVLCAYLFPVIKYFAIIKLACKFSKLSTKKMLYIIPLMFKGANFNKNKLSCIHNA